MSALETTLAGRTFRTSPRYELVLFDRLEDWERAALAELQTQRGFYGILRSRVAPADDAPSHSLRAVDRDTALLLLTLREPGTLPSYAREADPSCDGMRRLVLDGFVEIADGTGFVSGREAAALLWPDPNDQAPAPSALARISQDAIAYGAALALDEREALAMRLYSYNRLPFSTSFARRYPDAASILDALVDDTRLRQERWSVAAAKVSHWINFSRAHNGRANGAPQRVTGATYKLYVSPRPATLPDAFRELLDALVSHGVRQFKVAGTASGLLRPDKLVAYLDSREQLLAVADRLEQRLRGMPAHGVPFTAAIDADGLLSWGVDPPADARPLSYQPQQSWRSWITSALAGALIEARQNAGGMEPAAFAMKRLQLEGIDVDRWAPIQTLWKDDARLPA